MTDLTRSSKPLSLQLTLIFAWLAIIAGLSSMGDNEELEKVTETFTPNFLRFGALVQDILVFIVPVILFSVLLRREKLSFLTLGNKIHPLWIVASVFVIFFSVPLITWLGEVNSQIKLPASLRPAEEWMKAKENAGSKMTEVLLGDKTTLGIVLNFFIMAFLAALSEELFFRGLVQKVLTDSKMNYHLAIWLAAIIFSGFHMQFYGFFPRAALGAVMGYLFYFTGSLWISIIAHFINNALYIGIAYASDNVKVNPLEKSAEEPGLQVSWSMVGLSILLVIGVFIFLKRMMNSREEDI
jgi:uncharacterized protein